MKIIKKRNNIIDHFSREIIQYQIMVQKIIHNVQIVQSKYLLVLMIQVRNITDHSNLQIKAYLLLHLSYQEIHLIIYHTLNFPRLPMNLI